MHTPDETGEPLSQQEVATILFGLLLACLGAPLARLEAKVVFEELSGRHPGLRLADDQRVEFMPMIAFRAPTSLWVED